MKATSRGRFFFWLSLVVGLYNYNGDAIAAALEGLGKKGKVLAAGLQPD